MNKILRAEGKKRDKRCQMTAFPDGMERNQEYLLYSSRCGEDGGHQCLECH